MRFIDIDDGKYVPIQLVFATLSTVSTCNVVVLVIHINIYAHCQGSVSLGFLFCGRRNIIETHTDAEKLQINKTGLHF